jgi:catechol 2,3-dioxygenase-like lactoylglutathione lyase family enzyme
MPSKFPRMHVSFYVSDITKSVNFYSSFFGQAPDKIKPGYAKYVLDKPSLIISFIEDKGRVQANFGHAGFQVETREELKLKLEEATAKNLVSKIETGTKCCYAEQDKFWVNDPDQIQWEIYYFHADAEFNDPHYESDRSDPCCHVAAAETKSACGCSAHVQSAETALEKSACC